MKEKVPSSRLALAGLDIIQSSPFLSPRSPEKVGLSPCESLPDSSASFQDRDFVDLSSSSDDEDLPEIFKATEPSRPFAGFGSFRQRHGDFSLSTAARTRSGCRRGLSSEAPAKLGSHVSGLSQKTADVKKTDERKTQLPSSKTDFRVSRHARRSISTDLDREEAWERKKEMFLLDDEITERKRDKYLLDDEITDDAEEKHMRAVGRSSSDCGHETLSRPSPNSLPRTRARSLTDEDLEELRGSIDLGFGFRYDESCDLKRTLPALELYYAINRQLVDSKSRSSPVSPLEGTTLHRTSSAGSSCSPSNETWRVSSPGDHPSQVKTRLRHWAQAVACAVKQGF